MNRKTIDQEDQAAMDKWQVEFTEGALTEICKAIKDQEKVYGKEFGDKLKLSLLASLVCATLYEVLNSYKTDSGDLDQQTSIVHYQFHDAKEAIGMAVASGIETAARAWSGKEYQYYCEIQLEPAALNVKPC